MRKILRYNRICCWILIIIFMSTLILFIGCNHVDEGKGVSTKVRVTISNGQGYNVEQNIYEVERGSNLEIELSYLEGYAFESCDYQDYTILYENISSAVLILHDVRYPTFVNITSQRAGEGIFYHANGGIFTDIAKDYFFEFAHAAVGRRQNTSIGDNAVREGYTLTGWNTRSDGTGESVCLGGRITIQTNTIIDLYAQWSQWTEVGKFNYVEEAEGVKLTAYHGDDVETLTLPAEINGKPVIAVEKGFANKKKIDTLILPDTLKRIEKNAFTNCQIQNLYFYDNLEYVVNESFLNVNLKTLHLNARLAPRYLATSEVTEFADRMDRLILNQDKKKMIFFAGCSMGYGLDSQLVYDAFNGEYEIINFGTMGETHAGAQIDCIAKFLKQGDIFVHAPEPAAPQQLMYYYDMEDNMFLLCEGNFELISYIDMSKITGVFTAFNIFNSKRLKFDGGSYLDDSGLHNLYGDVITERTPTGRDISYDDYTYTFILELAESSAINRLCNEYDKISSMGAEVMFSFSPINYHGLTAEAIEQKIWEEFENAYEIGLMTRGYRLISKAEDYVFFGRYFYDTDYHLNDLGVNIRTERLIEDLKNVGVS